MKILDRKNISKSQFVDEMLFNTIDETKQYFPNISEDLIVCITNWDYPQMPDKTEEFKTKYGVEK